MDLRVLQYFLAIAREGNITRAAEFLHMTQPTLSRQIKDLEMSLGKKLLIRGNRRITLTDEGMLLRKRAEEIVSLLEKTEGEITASGETVSGDVFIGGGETEGMRFIARTAKRLRESYPEIQFHLFSGNAEDVTERLDKGLIDFGLFVGQADLKKYDYLPLPGGDTWGLILRRDDPLALRESITPEDMEGTPLICSRQTVLNNEMSGWLGRDFQTLNIAATYNLIYNASLMVEEGIGAALCIEGLINLFGREELCFRPLEPRVAAGRVLAWKKYQLFSRAAEKFIELTQSELSLDGD
ncbi:MAG: LysR family transcriptional regulator [Synergistaceae bacterium]|nr:LysR family transcriptional regulator [Synergistaceae bacterium]